MTKEQHIAYWVSQVDADFDCALVLEKAQHFSQALFWAHLTVEKLIKALWVKNNIENTPPFTHNLLRLVVLTGERFTEVELEYFSEMNVFQIKGRYPDYAENIEEIVTAEVCDEYLTKSKEIILCLHEKLR
jgi:HEPN domain-containing protein